jgi:hydrogenase nickel incorporation protein HypA/HybF
MHEYSIVQALLDRVEAEARTHEATLVYRVRVRIGEFAGVEPELLRSAFELVRESTLCAGAELEIVPSAAVWECRDCGTSIPRGAVLRCRICEGPARLASGDEILLEQIEMEAA